MTCEECDGVRNLPCKTCEGFGVMAHRCACGDIHAATCSTCKGHKRYHCTQCAPRLMRGRYFGEKVTDLP